MGTNSSQIKNQLDDFRRFLGQTFDAALSSRNFSPSDINYYENLGRKNRSPQEVVYSRTVVPSEQLRAKVAATGLVGILNGSPTSFISQLRNWVREGRN